MTEMQVMKDNGFKCEIEALYTFGIHVVKDFIAEAIQNQDYI